MQLETGTLKPVFELARRLDMNAFRISLEWSRIEPQKDRWDGDTLLNYRNMLLFMHQKRLNPIVTLNHFTLPLWILTPPSPSVLRNMALGEPSSTDPYWGSVRGWENEETVKEFIKY